MKKKLLYPFVLLITLCAISFSVHAQGFGEEGDPGGDLPPVTVTPDPCADGGCLPPVTVTPTPPPPTPPPPTIPPPDPCQLNPCSCNPQSCGVPPENPCVTNPCSCSPACNAAPPPPTGSQPPISVYGDHHLNTAKLPQQGVNPQIPGWCAYQTISNILAFFGVNVSQLTVAQVCAQQNPGINEGGGFTGTDQTLTSLVVAFLNTIPPPGIAPDNSISQDIDAGYPVMAYISVPGQAAYHEVMITGYNNDGTYVYFDPQSTLYVTAGAGTVFHDPIAVNGAR